MVTDHKSGVEAFKAFRRRLPVPGQPIRSEKRNKARKDQLRPISAISSRKTAPRPCTIPAWRRLRRYQAQVRAATEDEAKELIKPVIQLSKLLEQPLKIEGLSLPRRARPST